MSVLTKPRPTTPVSSPEIDVLMDHLINSLDVARSMNMTLLERLLEMSLIELGQTVAAHEKSERDRGLN